MKSQASAIPPMLVLLLGACGTVMAADQGSPTTLGAPLKGVPPKGIDAGAGKAAGGCCTMWTNGLEPCKQWTTPCPKGGGAAKAAPGAGSAGIAVSDPGVPADKPKSTTK